MIEILPNHLRERIPSQAVLLSEGIVTAEMLLIAVRDVSYLREQGVCLQHK